MGGISSLSLGMSVFKEWTSFLFHHTMINERGFRDQTLQASILKIASKYNILLYTVKCN